MLRGKFLVMATVGASAAALAAGSAEAQTAPPSYNTCSYSANGNLSQTYPHSCVATSVSGTPVGNWGQISGAGTAIVNGRVDGSVTYSSGGGIDGYSSGWSAGGWNNAASANSNAGTVASGSANLTDGTVHAFVTNPNPSWGAGFVTSEIADIVTFTNNSGSAIMFNVGYAFDGQFSNVTPGNGAANGFVSFALTSPDYTLRFGGSGNFMPGGTNGYASGGTSMFDAAGGGYGVPGYLGLSTLYDPRDYSFTGNFDPSGFVTGAFTTQLIIPVGVSQLGFALVLALDCRNHLATCNFGNTSALTFDPLPDGLSFTSESGQLFTAKAPAPGVPEPASWALMIVGLGVVGGTMRRRRMAVSFA